MKHPNLDVKKVTIKETDAYRVRVESWESISPQGLFAVDIIQECLDTKKNITESSAYNFHMTREEIKTLCEGLLSL